MLSVQSLLTGVPVTARSISAFPGSQDFRYSWGLGVAWSSPICPLKFSYAIPFGTKSYDRLQKFQFSAGTSF